MPLLRDLRDAGRLQLPAGHLLPEPGAVRLLLLHHEVLTRRENTLRPLHLRRPRASLLPSLAVLFYKGDGNKFDADY